MKQVKGWWLPDSDTHFSDYMTEEGYQVKQRTEILKQVRLRKPITASCIDVGSHVGFWAKDLTEQFKHVYAFDPIPEVRECFVKNITKDNYTLYPYGLGNETTSKKVLWSPEETGNTHVSEQGNLEIEIKRLDDFDLFPIDYIKIDAEGYEIEVCKGASELIKRDKPLIHVEAKDKVLVKQGLTRNDIQNFFASINYKQILKIKSELLYAPI